MDIVCPLGRNSRWKNEEIRFSIRSLFKHSIEEIGTIFIVGEKPDFFEYGDKLIHIPFKENQPKEVNIWEKVLAASLDERVSEEFLFTNDDYFFLNDFSLSTFPHYHKGDLKEQSWAKKPDHLILNSYHKKAKRTLKLLEKLKFSTWHFDIHLPNRYEKEKFVNTYNFFKPYLYDRDGLIISTCYGNYNKLEPTYKEDYKITKKGLNEFFNTYQDRLLFSIYDDAQCPQLLEFMYRNYPDKSPVEK